MDLCSVVGTVSVCVVEPYSSVVTYVVDRQQPGVPLDGVGETLVYHQDTYQDTCVACQD